jgi:methionyl-tRNA formyltransferase
MKFAALGRTLWLFDGIRLAAERGHEPVLVGTCPAAPEYTVAERDFKALARKLGVPFFCDPAINKPKYLALAQKSGAEVAISVNWLTLIGAKMLGAFKHGVVNAHAGDLPRYRGNAAPNWAILNGEKEVAVTLHRMVEELDAGPIFLQRRFPLGPDIYIGEVYEFMNANIPGMFAELLDGLASGSLVPREQPKDPALALRCLPRRPEDGLIDWRRPAEEITRLVRASAEPFAGAYTCLDGRRLVVWRARTGRLPFPHLGVPGQVIEVCQEEGEVLILTGDDLLVLEEVALEGGKRLRAAEVIRSGRARLGLDLEADNVSLRERVERLEAALTRRHTRC